MTADQRAEFDVDNPQRTLNFECKLWIRRERGSLEARSWSMLQVLVLDHQLMILKTTESPSGVSWLLEQAPIPLDLLEIKESPLPCKRRPSTRAPSLQRRGSQCTMEELKYPESPAYPILVYNRASQSEYMTLYADSVEQRQALLQATRDAAAIRLAQVDLNPVSARISKKASS